VRGFFSSHIIAILAAILFPVFAKAREKSRQTACLSNVKQLALAVMQYAQDYDERTPGAYGNDFNVGPISGFGSWWSYIDMIYPYVKNSQVYRCPSSTGGFSYNVNQWAMPGAHGPFGRPLAQFTRPAECIMLFDSPGLRSCGYPHGYRLDADGPWAHCYGIPAVDERAFVAAGNTYAQNFERHNGGCNYAMMDGHAKWLSNADTFCTGTSHPAYQRYWAPY